MYSCYLEVAITRGGRILTGAGMEEKINRSYHFPYKFKYEGELSTQREHLIYFPTESV